MNVTDGALVDEPSVVCDCWCDCYALVAGDTLRCADCEQGEHLHDDAGGEG